MQLLSLLNVPSQSFVTTQNGNRFTLRLHECNGNMCADITMNGADILDSVRIVSGTPLVPFDYMTQGNGNFIFICMDENCIDYNLFGVTQFLYYLTEAELQSIGALPPASLALTAAQQAQFNAAIAVIPTGYLPLPP